MRLLEEIRRRQSPETPGDMFLHGETKSCSRPCTSRSTDPNLMPIIYIRPIVTNARLSKIGCCSAAAAKSLFTKEKLFPRRICS